MNSHQVVRRLRAHQAGSPLPNGETLRVHVGADRDVLIVAFVRMGGESRPWGVAYGHPDEVPTIASLAEPRNRDAAGRMMAPLGAALSEHLRSAAAGYQQVDANSLRPLRQVWLPNATHLDMLHHLNYAYTFTTFGDEHREALNALGRASGWLFRESQRPGSMATIVATTALREAFTFPVEDVRQGHLGYLMAWLAPGSPTDRARRAREAERLSSATSLDPHIERDDLQKLVEAFGDADRRGDTRAAKPSADRIRAIIDGELLRRWNLTRDAIVALRADPRRENCGLERLVAATAAEQYYQYNRTEKTLVDVHDGFVFVPSVETDRYPAAAGARFLVHNAAAELLSTVLLHDDTELQAEAIASGHGFRGRVIAVRDDSESSRSTRPVWTILDPDPGPLRFREGSKVCVAGLAGRVGEIRSIRSQADGSIEIEVEVTALKTARKDAAHPHNIKPASADWIGHELTFLKASASDISDMKARRIWDRSGPGSWLTHRRPGGDAAILADPDDDRDDVAAGLRATS